MFGRMKGHEGMFLVLVALDCEIVWLVPGRLVTQGTLAVTLGTSRDKSWRASEIGMVLEQCFKHSHAFPRVALHTARLECSAQNKVEELAHHPMATLFASTGCKLSRPLLAPTAVD